MSLRLYMDHNVPAAITRGLRARGIDTLTAHEDRAAQLPDELLLQRATELGRTLFTQDDDLLTIAAEFIQTNRPFSGLIYAHPLRVTLGQAIADLELLSISLSPDEIGNTIIWLPF